MNSIVAIAVGALILAPARANGFTGIPEEDSLAVVEAPPFESIASELPDSSGSPELPIEDLDRGIDVAAYADHPRVASYLRYFSGRGRSQMERWLERGARYLPMIQGRLEEEGLPEDLSYLALIESGFSNNAVSRAGAVGMWQFMPGTARAYGLRVDRHVDERRNPVKATDAAVRHLRDLTDRFGSPYLAAAAYNAGAGRVSTGLERLRSMESNPGGEHATDAGEEPTPVGNGAGHPADIDFFRLSDSDLLARETRNYVPQLIAAALIARDPGRYGFHVGKDTLAADLVAELEVVRRDRVTRSKLGGTLAERSAGTRDATARTEGRSGTRPEARPERRSVGEAEPGPNLGPGERSGQAPGAARTRERPRREAFAAARFRAERGRESGWARRETTRERPAPSAFQQRHALVRRGDTIEAIARRYEVSVERLRKANAIPEWYVMRAGMVLTLPSS